MKSARFALLLLVSLTLAAPAVAQPPAAAVKVDAKKSATAARARKSAPGALAPLPEKPVPTSSHAPFEAGDCKICHQSADPRNPGPVVQQGPALCLQCHEEFAGVLKRPHVHAPARTDCVSCHNPHNANYRKLLLQAPRALCSGCHDKTARTVASATVPHKAVTTGRECTACHNPHGSNVEKLLVQLPFDLCLSCHNVDTMADANGKKLQNLKAWLDHNKNWHGPVAAKDCNSCHEPHGGTHFRLLKADYPQPFYAPYDARTYELCFSCHQETAFSTALTGTLTSFRNGTQNLHFVHLQQSGRGRTCRACHEVHASKQDNHIREGVPYGSGGWVLKLHFKKNANGGSCEKTCHSEKSYVNKAQR